MPGLPALSQAAWRPARGPVRVSGACGRVLGRGLGLQRRPRSGASLLCRAVDGSAVLQQRQLRLLQRLRRQALAALVELSILVMRWQWTAAVLLSFIPLPGAHWLLKPFFSLAFLTALLRHERVLEAVTSLLRRRRSGRSLAPMLRFHGSLGRLCTKPELRDIVKSIIRKPGVGPFLQSFLVEADYRNLVCFLRNRGSVELIAGAIVSAKPEDAAQLCNSAGFSLAPAVVSICTQPGLESWGSAFIGHPGLERWMGRFLTCPGGAVFAKEVMLSEGFLDYVKAILEAETTRVFVVNLLQQPCMDDFVTWLNRDESMRRWFAQIVAADATMVLLTEMLLQPGIDSLVVEMMLQKGNDQALRGMLEHWVRGKEAEQSLLRMVSSFSKKPKAAQALARVILSPGFLDTFLLRRLLLQPGLAEVVVDAVFLVGLRGLADTVLPLVLSTLAAMMIMQAEGAGPTMEQWGRLFWEASPEEFVGMAALLLA